MAQFGDRRVFPSAVLAVVAVWALAAATMLLATYASARSIEGEVDFIFSQVTEIDDDTEAVNLSRRTAALSRDIEEQVEPLDGQLAVVVDEARSIDDDANSVASSAASIRRSVEAIQGDASDIRSTVGTIEDLAEAILAEAHAIDAGVTGINERAAQVIDLARAIRADIAEILAQVGLDHGAIVDAPLHGHANSIDCSPALIAFSTECGE